MSSLIPVRSTLACMLSLVVFACSDAEITPSQSNNLVVLSAATPNSNCANPQVLSVIDTFSDFPVDDNYTTNKAVDGNLDEESRWSSFGRGNSIVVDLGSTSNVGAINAAWYRGNLRTSYFDVETSVDNVSWNPVLESGSASGSDDFINFELQHSNARYVKVIGQGNSLTEWNSLVEMQIFSCDPVEATLLLITLLTI